MATDENRDEIEQLIRQSCQVPPPDDEFVRTLAARQDTNYYQRYRKVRRLNCRDFERNRRLDLGGERPSRSPGLRRRFSSASCYGTGRKESHGPKWRKPFVPCRGFT